MRLHQVNLSSSQCVAGLKNIGKMSLTQILQYFSEMAHSVRNDNVVPPNCSLYLKKDLGFSEEYVWVCSASVSVETNVSGSGKWHKRHISSYFSSGSITIISSCQSKLDIWDIWDMYSCWKWILTSISVFDIFILLFNQLISCMFCNKMLQWNKTMLADKFFQIHSFSSFVFLMT